MLKICDQCERPKDCFRIGYSICYDCELANNRARYAEQYAPDPAFKERRRQYNERHVEEIKSYQTDYREKNHEELLQSQAEYRAANRKRLSEIEAKQRESNKMKLIQLFGGCCIECGFNKYHGALDFHHRDPSTKLFDISKKLSVRSEKAWQLVVEEAKKCDLLCANCHREK